MKFTKECVTPMKGPRFNKKVVSNWDKHGFVTMNLYQNDSPWNRKNTPEKKEFQVQLSVKWFMLTGVWDMRGLIPIDFFEK